MTSWCLSISLYVVFGDSRADCWLHRTNIGDMWAGGYVDVANNPQRVIAVMAIPCHRYCRCYGVISVC